MRLLPLILQDKFHLLPEIIQDFHQKHRITLATGNFSVKRSKNPIINFFMNRFNIPETSKKAETRLKVTFFNSMEYWSRTISTWHLNTKQFAKSGMLVETMNQFKFYFKINIICNRVYYHHIKTKFWKFTLPQKLFGEIRGLEYVSSSKLYSYVEFKSRLLGKILTYGGALEYHGG